MKRLVLLFPRRWRHRYGQEVAELLAASPHPWRDGLNVAAQAVLVWLGVPVVKIVVLVITALALVGFGFTVGQLADGVSEIPRHWWSSASAALTLSLLVGTGVIFAKARPAQYEDCAD